MTRDAAVAAARSLVLSGRFEAALAELVACRTDDPDGAVDYLQRLMIPHLTALGFRCEVLANAVRGSLPILHAERIEDPALPTVLTYGHGDTVPLMTGRWAEDRDPLALSRDGDRLYGRGTADNKGQHLINLLALETVLTARNGRLGFNLRLALEMGEEAGSPGLAETLEACRDRFGADVLIASDGPRVRADRPTMFLGSRGAINFTLTCALREGAHHSGNWGGLLRDPAIRLAHALAAIADARGVIRIPEWRPDSLAPEVREAIATCPVGEEGPEIDLDWGERDLTPGERVWGWNSFCIRAMTCGDPAAPVNAIQPSATAHCQLRFVVGTPEADILPALSRHLAREGFHDIAVSFPDRIDFHATRLDPASPWAAWAAASLERTHGSAPSRLPNLGGSLPNEVFSDLLGLPTVWIPHSHPGCSQHAPDEHMLVPVCEDALALMAGLWWDMGEPGVPARGATAA